MNPIQVHHWSFTKIEPPIPGAEPVVFLNGFIPGNSEEMSLGGVVSMKEDVVETTNQLYKLGEISPRFAQDHIEAGLEVPTAAEFSEYLDEENTGDEYDTR
jgi:hypothetical protein